MPYIETRYRVVFGACLTQFTVIGLLFAFGLFFKPLQDEFGWSRTLLSSASSLSFFMMGLLAILGGRMNDRFGPRIVLAFTGTAYAIGFLLLSQVTAPWQLFAIFGIFMGLGMGTHDVVTLSTIARWFENRRGIMSGVVKTGTALGQITVPPLAAALLLAYGWRQTLVILGCAALVLLLLAAFSMQRPPALLKGTAGAAAQGQGFAEARATQLFWTLCAIQFLFFPSMMSVPMHLAVHGIDLGMSTARAATLLSVLGATSIAGRLTVGTLSDRIGGKRAFLMCFSILLASLIAFASARSHGLLFAVVAVYGFGHGGLFTVVSPTVAEFFGMRAHGAIFGTILFFGTIGGAVGPIVVGWIFDTTGSYQWAFTLLAVLAAIGLALVLTLPGKSTAVRLRHLVRLVAPGARGFTPVDNKAPPGRSQLHEPGPAAQVIGAAFQSGFGKSGLAFRITQRPQRGLAAQPGRQGHPVATITIGKMHPLVAPHMWIAGKGKTQPALPTVADLPARRFGPDLGHGALQPPRGLGCINRHQGSAPAENDAFAIRRGPEIGMARPAFHHHPPSRRQSVDHARRQLFSGDDETRHPENPPRQPPALGAGIAIRGPDQPPCPKVSPFGLQQKPISLRPHPGHTTFGANRHPGGQGLGHHPVMGQPRLHGPMIGIKKPAEIEIRPNMGLHFVSAQQLNPLRFDLIQQPGPLCHRGMMLSCERQLHPPGRLKRTRSFVQRPRECVTFTPFPHQSRRQIATIGS